MSPDHILTFIVAAPAILAAITFHEFAHARVALAFGDDTAESQGRVSLNPLVHLDPIGTLAILFSMLSGIGLGWGKPVPVNPNLYRHPRGELWVSAAGPLSNFILAALSALPLRFLAAPLVAWGTPGEFFLGFLNMMILLNLSLGFFNLIPLGPLDGSHALANLLPLERAYRFNQFNNAYGMQVLFALLALGWFTPVSPISAVIGPPIRFLYRWLLGL